MEYDIKHLILDVDLDVHFDVDEDDDESLNDDRIRNFGRYVQVIKVEYDGMMCAAKQLIKDGNMFFRSRLTYFKRECLMHSKLSHPNIVKMLGVCYNGSVESRFGVDSIPWPVLVMELVTHDLSDLELFATPMYVKLSILQDISRGLQYLHTDCSPPIVHCNLSIFSILLTENLIGKICDFRLSQEMLPDIEKIDKHPEAASDSSLPCDVLLFGCVACQVATKRCDNLKPLHKVEHTSQGKVCSIDTTRLQSYVSGISDKLVKQFLVECIDDDPNKRPSISVIHETIKRTMNDLYADDKTIKNAYSMALKEGKTQSRDLQVLLIGAENTGKTCLVSSFLGEKFIEGQAATEGVDMDVCKIFCKNWKRITHSDKINHLYDHFLSEFKGNAMMWIPTEENTDEAVELQSSAVAEENQIVDSADSVQAAVRLPLKSDTFPEPHPHDLQKAFSSTPQYDHYCLNAVVWDFAGQTIFHNTHSLFISEEGVPIITFDASKDLRDPVIPREYSLSSLECSTGISSIHYWLQVVDSMCSMEGSDDNLSPLLPTALLAGTHIDKLHPDIKMARKIAKQKILPILEKELREKPYVQHLAGSKKSIKFALENYCLFISNKCRDKELERLKTIVVKSACSLKKKQPVFFLKIEQAILNYRDNVISKSMMCEIVSSNAFSINEKSPEFEEIMKYFHNKRTFLHFSQVESLQDIVVLSPSWLAKLFSYVIAACSYDFLGSDLDKAWKRLTGYGVLQENILQHMLKKFYTDYPSKLHITYQQVVDILLCFHLLARITRVAWFSEEGYPSLPESGDVFIVPSLVPSDSTKTPPNTDCERIVYFLFQDSFIPTSLLSQLITNCIDRNVKRNDRLLWMRQGMVGLQLGAHQKYYISRCKEKQSIQLTITTIGNDWASMQERKQLIDDVGGLLDDIMKVFMPAAKKPLLFVPCSLCSTLHIPLQDICSGNTIFCPKSGDTALPSGYYGDLLSVASVASMDHGPVLANTDALTSQKFEVFKKYYSRLSRSLPIKNLSPHFVTEDIITFKEEEEILNGENPCGIFLRKIAYSLEGGTDTAFDKMLRVIHEHGDSHSKELINEINREL